MSNYLILTKYFKTLRCFALKFKSTLFYVLASLVEVFIRVMHIFYERYRNPQDF